MFTKIICAILFAMVLSAAGAMADPRMMLYGIGYSKCSEITKNLSTTRVGRTFMETYVGGFLTGANTLAKETDNGTGVALGIGLEDISKPVFRYCAKHPAADGAEAIMATLLENAKNDGGSE